MKQSIIKTLQVVVSGGLTLLSANAFANCIGYSGPGGGLYTGPGGGLYTGVTRTLAQAVVPIRVLAVAPTVAQEDRATPGLAEDRMTNGTALRLTVNDAHIA
jgi:hypothetical protein